METAQNRMLKDISILDFALVDLMLFLDTHPLDQNAMEYFNHYSQAKNRLSLEFSRKYYPLTKDLAESNTNWRWGNAPLPWEGGC